MCDTSETALRSPLPSQQPSYDAIMKNLRPASFLFFVSAVLLAANALSQTDNPPARNETPSSIAAARCAYAADTDCVDPSGTAHAPRRAIDDATVAQLPHRGPGPAFGPRGPMGGHGYPQMWQSQPSAGHALIGAVIGAALGWAVAAKGNAGAGATLALAGVGAGTGAAFGLSIPSFPSRSRHWRRWPDDDEDATARESTKPGRSPSRRLTASTDANPANLLTNAQEASSSTATP